MKKIQVTFSFNFAVRNSFFHFQPQQTPDRKLLFGTFPELIGRPVGLFLQVFGTFIQQGSHSTQSISTQTAAAALWSYDRHQLAY